jgi:hypothetical protein
MSKNTKILQQHLSLKPVIKCPRSEWHIPRIDAHARLLEQQREETRLAALMEGTTPQGREILRKLIFRAERMLEEKHTILQIVPVIENELNIFECLHSEFLLLLSRLWGGDFDGWYKLRTKEIAILIVFRLKLKQEIQRCKNT